jgi:Lon protease-like protein
MAESSERFPLFPLGLVLLPGEVVPLHIFEERYKTMVGECLEDGTEFGIVWSGDEGIRDVGCAAEVAQLIETTEDGRMNILVKGTRRFTLQRRIEDMPYPAGDVTWTEDTDPVEGTEAGPAARKAYADLVERVTDTRPGDAELTELDAYGMASTIAFDPGEKQGLLELLTEDERLDLLARLCTTALTNLTRSQEAAERASTNGKVHH